MGVLKKHRMIRKKERKRLLQRLQTLLQQVVVEQAEGKTKKCSNNNLNQKMENLICSMCRRHRVNKVERKTTKMEKR